MKVLMVSKACVVGTYQRKLEELARLEGIELMAVVPPYWQEESRRVELEPLHTRGYRLQVEQIRFNGRFHIFYFPGLPRRLREFRPDIVHVDEEPYNLATFHALWLARRYGAKSLFFTWQNLHRIYPPPFRWMEIYSFKAADCAIAGNAEAVDVLRRKGFKKPAEVIPQFGVDPDLFHPLLRPWEEKGGRLGSSPSAVSQHLELTGATHPSWNRPPETHPPSPPFRIGYVGRLVEQKGIMDLLAAVAGLGGNWTLTLVGAGPLQGEIERRAAALGMSHRLTIIPGVPSARMPGILNSLDVLVLPSRTRPNWKEQFGRVLVEAMACELPVVGSSSGEIPNVIGDAGMIFPEGDVVALRAHLERLMASPGLRHQMGKLGRARVLERFTHARIAEQTYRVYLSMGS